MGDFQAQLQALREAFAAELPGRLEAVENAWAPRTLEAAKDLLFQAHRLAGASGTFGFAALSTASRELELLLKPLTEAERLEPEAHARIDAALDPLRRAAAEGRPAPPPEAAPLRHEPGTWVLSGDLAADCEELAGQLRLLGHEARILAPFPNLHREWRALMPEALVLATDFPEPSPWTDGSLSGLLDSGLIRPMLFVSSRRDDFAGRLQAVRAGAEAYFLRPQDTEALAARLDRLRLPDGGPLRVVLVEDDPVVLQEHALVLEQAGMQVERVQDPRELLASIGAQPPDLFLMDWYLPTCHGPELASLVRQVPSFAGVPIVFLSAERNVSRQLAALSRGGDDFLTKPIDAEHLVSAVSTKALRGRALRAHMVRDPLTGLLNHTALEERLDQSMALALRRGGPLSFAMVDLDHFKQVNDTYGHPAGDRVLKGLARSFQQRLRRSDALGRYGGEEFAVLLQDTPLAEARTLLEELLVAFRGLAFEAEGRSFSCTFSCGIAEFPAHGTPEDLRLAADQALYRAKAQGRNRVIADSL